MSAAPARAAVTADSSLVYYLRRGGLIKIGYTAKFVDRMRKLRPDELLAVEPGNIPLETGRHLQFAAYRVLEGADGREWYQPAAELLDHIARTAAMYEAPELPASPVARERKGPMRRASTWRGSPPEPLTPEERDAAYILAMFSGADLDGLDDETLFSIGKATFHARRILQVVVYELNERGETFADIGKHLDVHEATVSRWAKPPTEDRRRRPVTEVSHA